MRNIFLHKSCKNEVRWIVPDLFLFLKKALHKRNISGGTLALIYFNIPGLGHAVKTNSVTAQIVHPKICSILIFHKRVWE